MPETDDEGPAADRLLRPYFGMHRFDWAGQSGVEFYLGYGDWIRLLRGSGFEVVDLIEIRAPDDLAERRGDGLVDQLGQTMACGAIWRVRKMKPPIGPIGPGPMDESGGFEPLPGVDVLTDAYRDGRVSHTPVADPSAA